MKLTKLTITTFFLILAGATVSGLAQDAAVKPSVIAGDVASVGTDKIVLNTKDGVVDVILSAKTTYKRVPPENPNPAAAVPSQLSDIGEGDKLLVTGFLSADKKSLPARAVYLMTKASISEKSQKDAAEWKTRGITGRVVSVDPVAKTVGVEVRGMMGNSTTVTLSPKDNAKFLRYSSNSIKFADAKPSSILEVQKGDQLRALGDKNAEGTTFAAEEVITGAFQTIAGTVKSVDAAKGEVVITNLQTRKDVTIAIESTSLLKQFPEDMATRLAGFQAGGAQSGETMPPPQRNVNEGQPGGARQGFGGARVGGNLDDMFDRLPVVALADLKVGSMIGVLTPKTDNIDRLTAIKLIAGVEPFLRTQAGAGMRRGGATGEGADFNIPGLEGFGN